ncbi:DUF6368 family protein [Streptomyces sp. NPDC003314]
MSAPFRPSATGPAGEAEFGAAAGGGSRAEDGGGARGATGPCLIDDQTVAVPTWWNRVRTARGHDSSGAACRDRQSDCDSPNRASSRTSWPIVVPWPESFCEPVETRVGSGLDFRVRDGPAMGLPAWDPTGVGGLFLSEDEETPAEDEDYPAFSRPSLRGLVLGTGRSGPANCQPPGHLALALAERLDAFIDFDGLPSSPAPP